MRELNKNEIEAINGGCIEAAVESAGIASAFGKEKGWSEFGTVAFSLLGAAVGGIFGTDIAAKLLKVF